MFFKRITLRLLLSFCILFSSFSAHAGFANVIQWIIACGWPAFTTIGQLENVIGYKTGTGTLDSSDSDAPPSVRDYVRHQLKNVIKDPDTLQVKISSYAGPWDYETNGLDRIIIGVDQKTKKSVLEDLLGKNSSSLTTEDQKKFSMIDFSLHHEASHIKNIDTYKNIIANIIVITLVYKGFRAIKKYLDNRLPPRINGVVKISSAVGLGILSLLLLKACSRYQEFKADDAVANTKELIEGGIALMTLYKGIEDHEKNFVSNMTKSWPESRRKKVAQVLLNVLTSDIYRSHPKSEGRLERLKKRIVHT